MTRAVFSPDGSCFTSGRSHSVRRLPREHLFPICQICLNPLQSPDQQVFIRNSHGKKKRLSQQFNFHPGNWNTLESFICVCSGNNCRRSKLALRALGVSARRRWHVPFTPRLLLTSHTHSVVTSHNKERRPELSSIKRGLLWPIKRQWAARERGVLATWSDKRILQTQIKQCWKWESDIMFG